MPPLRAHPEDIPVLAQRIFESRPGAPQLSAGAIAALQAYAWPGNVRELRNVLERAALLSEHRVLTAADLRLDAGTAQPSATLPLQIVSIEENERRYLEQVLDAKSGRVDECAQALGVPLSSLYQRLKRLGIPLARG